MASLEQVQVGSRVSGIVPGAPVAVVAVKWHGDSVLSVTYKDEAGSLGETMLYRFNEDSITIEGASSWTFDADGEDLKLASEARRISLASVFDPYMAARNSDIQPLPHQISAVYQEMLPRLPLRYVLADDPGAGKTIMTGLLVKEMIARGDLVRCLIVSPGNLVEQWQDELWQKFGLRFTILTNDLLEAAATGNAFLENDLCIARLDKLSRNDDVGAKLGASRWDLVVCDEAHKMSATVFGNEAKYTKRFQLGRLLGDLTENLLLLTATPHNGKPKDFQLFMSLIDKDRFEGIHGRGTTPGDVSDVMRRLVKEELLTFEGKPLFPERRAYTVNYSLSDAERDLYDRVTQYVREEFNRADALDGKRRSSVGFALTTLQRRLASSPEAIYQSLRRRRVKLEEQLSDVETGKRALQQRADAGFDPGADDFDEDDYTPEELEGYAEGLTDASTAAATVEELKAEIATLRLLEGRANSVRRSGEDRKWEELSRLLQDEQEMFGPEGREKLIVFTEHKDTLVYLADKIRSLIGRPEAVLTIQGGMSRDARRDAETRFRQDKDVRILIATDAAGEGINLQRAHLMVNYDLPWNPNRIEQRFGRIHRIGQTEVCHLWNLVSNETREGDVFTRLFQKLESERSALGGRVFDVLGELQFDDRPLADLLLEAVRYGDDPKVKARLDSVVDSSLDSGKLSKLLEDYALTNDVITSETVASIREDMERAAARKLEPHFICAFALEALARAGARVARREPGRYEIERVPSDVRSCGAATGAGSVQGSYERVCFEKSLQNVEGLPVADLLCPGHPLLDALIAWVDRKYGSALKRGAVFVDDQDWGTDPRLLFYVENAVQEGRMSGGNRRIVSKDVRFVEVDKHGNERSAGLAPYLDYRRPKPSEEEVVEDVLADGWLDSDVEERAVNYAIQNILPRYFESVAVRRKARIKKERMAVRARLTDEISYWGARAVSLREGELAGKRNSKLNSDMAARKSDDLIDRLERRMADLDAQENLSPRPPLVIGGALVIPVGLVWALAGGAPDELDVGDRKAKEAAGMLAVARIEDDLGNRARDVSSENEGYDIESREPDADGMPGRLRGIEVKAFGRGVKNVTVTKNEIMRSLNMGDNYILALVEVDGDVTRTTYLNHDFMEPDMATNSVSFDIQDLIGTSRVLLTKEETWQ